MLSRLLKIFQKAFIFLELAHTFGEIWDFSYTGDFGFDFAPKTDGIVNNFTAHTIPDKSENKPLPRTHLNGRARSPLLNA